MIDLPSVGHHSGTGGVSPCKHCRRIVIRDAEGLWLHVTGETQCRDPWGVNALATVATPSEPPLDLTLHPAVPPRRPRPRKSRLPPAQDSAESDAGGSEGHSNRRPR